MLEVLESVSGAEYRRVCKERDEHKAAADLYRNELAEVSKAVAFMEHDNSLGLVMGERFYVEGIKALRWQRDFLLGVLSRTEQARHNHLDSPPEARPEWLQKQLSAARTPFTP
jgi:hypothetical protein